MGESMAALYLAGVDISWNEFHCQFEDRLRLVDLPTYAWNNKNYWLQYNGDWCLTKGNSFYANEKQADGPATAQKRLTTSAIQTSTVQQITEETFHDAAGTVTIRSDLMQADFLAAANGHRMNNCGVITSVSQNFTASGIDSY